MQLIKRASCFPISFIFFLPTTTTMTSSATSCSNHPTYIKYRQRLSEPSPRDFAVLDGQWVSIHKPPHKGPNLAGGQFSKWKDILNDEEQLHGATPLGRIPFDEVVEGVYSDIDSLAKETEHNDHHAAVRVDQGDATVEPKEQKEIPPSWGIIAAFTLAVQTALLALASTARFIFSGVAPVMPTSVVDLFSAGGGGISLVAMYIALFALFLLYARQ